MSVRTLLLRSAGSNCDVELGHAFELAGSEVDLIHINRIIESPASLDAYDILAIPGGFTYGDDVAAGKVLANELKHRLGDALRSFFDKDRLGFGVCNGFQVLVKMGLLPDASDDGQRVTLADNSSGKFEDRWITLSSVSEKCLWTSGIDKLIELPIAHGEGRFVTKTKGDLIQLKDHNQIVFRYVARDGSEPSYPDDPNGSEEFIAGICDPSGRILGMMPHPERNVENTQHPRWMREGLKREGDGLQIFRNAVNAVA